MAGGRQLAFDKEQALQNAMKVFWEKGFLGASLTDLTDSMGIKKPSMYATFGNKEALFVQATEYYLQNFASNHLAFLQDTKQAAKARLQNYMMSVIAAQCSDNLPKGCYISLSVSESASGALPEEAMSCIQEAAHCSIEALTQFFQEHQASFNTAFAPADKALYLISVLHGTAAMARANKSLSELTPVVGQAMLALV